MQVVLERPLDEALDGAMQLYQQSLDLDEALGNVRGKSTTLHAMAGVQVRRGDLVLVKGSRGTRTDLVADRLAAEFA